MEELKRNQEKKGSVGSIPDVPKSEKPEVFLPAKPSTAKPLGPVSNGKTGAHQPGQTSNESLTGKQMLANASPTATGKEVNGSQTGRSASPKTSLLNQTGQIGPSVTTSPNGALSTASSRFKHAVEPSGPETDPVSHTVRAFGKPAQSEHSTARGNANETSKPKASVPPSVETKPFTVPAKPIVPSVDTSAEPANSCSVQQEVQSLRARVATLESVVDSLQENLKQLKKMFEEERKTWIEKKSDNAEMTLIHI